MHTKNTRMRTILPFIVALITITLFSKCSLHCDTCGKEERDPCKAEQKKIRQLKEKIKHVVVIYQENWSFDGLYGSFPGANNRSNANTYQVDKNGNLLDTVKYPMVEIYPGGKPLWIVDTSFKNLDPDKKSLPLAAKPYDLINYNIRPDVETGDITHRFYTEQLQIDNGKMDKFAAYSENPGLVQSYFDATNMPEGKLAQQYTLCDNFFHSAFGGSFLNHIWLIAAATPVWKNAPDEFVCKVADTELYGYDNKVTTDGYAVNTVYSVNTPHGKDDYYLPNQTMPTIGDRLNDQEITWAWYSGGWNDAIAGHPDAAYFQYHHQPFVYFENFKDGTENKKNHLKDETDFFADIKSENLPQVCFIKALGINNEHPGYANLERGQKHVDSLVKLIMNSKYSDDCVIIIAYDEHGGRWDHVPSPKIDRWGPGSRVPCIIISKYARKNFIDHTQYETVSILKFIETLHGLKPLSSRDSAANGLMNAFQF